VWRDTSQVGRNMTSVARQRAAGQPEGTQRLEILDAGAGSLAIFRRAQVFFARENEVNLGYVYTAKTMTVRFLWE